MFPLRDDAPRLGFPFVTLGLIAINVVVYVYQLSLYVESPAAAEALLQTLGAIPMRTQRALAGQYPLAEGLAPLFTSMFLHGGLLHLIGNVWFLWIFGDNVEDELGHGTYLGFYLACGLIASLAHFAADPSSTLPAVGASGAISGVMGAYVVRFPWARIVMLVPIVFFFFTVEVPALFMLVYWFLIQFMSGAASIGAPSAGGVAWWAHIGGFVAGAILIWSRPKRRRHRRPYYY